MPEREVTAYQSEKDGDWYWHEEVGGDVVADGSEGYKNRSDAVHEASVATGVPESEIVVKAADDS